MHFNIKQGNRTAFAKLLITSHYIILHLFAYYYFSIYYPKNLEQTAAKHNQEEIDYLKSVS